MGLLPRFIFGVLVATVVLLLFFGHPTPKGEDAAPQTDPTTAPPSRVLAAIPTTFFPDSKHSGTNLVELQVFSSSIGTRRIPQAEFDRITRELEEIIQKDITAGLNAEVRAKQEKIQLLSVGLKKGMDIKDAIQLMGTPDRVTSLFREPEAFGIQAVDSLELVPDTNSCCISYWPRTGVQFDGRNGQGYKVLYIQFNTQRKLEAWVWQQPIPSGAGSLSSVLRQEHYWRGPFEVSPAPPTEVVAELGR